MAEQLAVEVDVKNVTHTVRSTEQDKPIYFVWINEYLNHIYVVSVVFIYPVGIQLCIQYSSSSSSSSRSSSKM